MFWLLLSINPMGTTPKGCTLNLPCCHQEESREQGVLNFDLENKALSEYLPGEAGGTAAPALVLSCSRKADIWGMSTPALCITKAVWRLSAWAAKAEHCKGSCRSRTIPTVVVICISPGPGSGLAPFLSGSPAKRCTGEAAMTRDHQSDDHDNQSTLTQLH